VCGNRHPTWQRFIERVLEAKPAQPPAGRPTRPPPAARALARGAGRATAPERTSGDKRTSSRKRAPAGRTASKSRRGVREPPARGDPPPWRPNVLRVVEEPLPQPKPGQARIRVEAIGVAFADLLIRRGLYPGAPPLPLTPGYDCVGIVDALAAACASPSPERASPPSRSRAATPNTSVSGPGKLVRSHRR